LGGSNPRVVGYPVGELLGVKISTPKFLRQTTEKTSEPFRITLIEPIELNNKHLLAALEKKLLGNNGEMGGQIWGFSGFSRISGSRISVVLKRILNFFD
jgi:hypothetical protein